MRLAALPFGELLNVGKARSFQTVTQSVSIETCVVPNLTRTIRKQPSIDPCHIVVIGIVLTPFVAAFVGKICFHNDGKIGHPNFNTSSRLQDAKGLFERIYRLKPRNVLENMAGEYEIVGAIFEW